MGRGGTGKGNKRKGLWKKKGAVDYKTRWREEDSNRPMKALREGIRYADEEKEEKRCEAQGWEYSPVEKR